MEKGDFKLLTELLRQCGKLSSVVCRLGHVCLPTRFGRQMKCTADIPINCRLHRANERRMCCVRGVSAVAAQDVNPFAGVFLVFAYHGVQGSFDA